MAFECRTRDHEVDRAGAKQPSGVLRVYIYFSYIILLVFLSLGCITNSGAEVLDRIEAVVEAQVISDKPVTPRMITRSEVEDMVRPILAKLQVTGEKVDPQLLRKKALEELILRSLRNQKAEQLEVDVKDADIDGLMSQVEQNNALPLGALPQALAREGIDLEEYRQGLRDQLLQSRLINRVIRPLVSVSDEEVGNLYGQATKNVTTSPEVRLGQILLELNAGAPPDQVTPLQEKAKGLAEQLRKGVSLASLAGQFSDDSSGLKGGEIGWFKKGELLAAMEDVVFNLPEGAVSDPIRSPQGIHIFKVLEKRSHGASTPGGGEIKVKARHILIKVKNSDDEARAHKRITEIQEEVLRTKSFADLAKKYSEDDGTAQVGGDLGWFGKGTMVPAFDKVAFALEKGGMSDPVRTPFGWHLILLEEKKQAEATSRESQKEELQKRVLEAKIQSRYRQWLRDLRLRAFVEYR